MTKTCFRGGRTKAYAGARVAEYGTIGGASERSQVVLRTPKLESDLCPPTCAFRAGADGGGGEVPIQTHPLDNAIIFVGNHRVLRTCAWECQAYVFIALGMRSTPSARQIRAQDASDAPRAAFDSATVEPKQAGHTHACHKACVQGLAKPLLCA